MDLQFEWEEAKATANAHKHGVSFEEAITIFDTEHSSLEDRSIDIGLSTSGRVLVVVYTERGTSIRIISCRKATPAERRQYERQAI